MSSENQNKQSLSVDAIASQWVNLVFAHLDYNRQSKKVIKNNKKENKYEQSAN